MEQWNTAEYLDRTLRFARRRELDARAEIDWWINRIRELELDRASRELMVAEDTAHARCEEVAS